MAKPELKAAVAKLCSVRKATLGSVTKMLRDHHRDDSEKSLEVRKRNKANAISENVRLAKIRAEGVDVAQETDLCSAAGLKVQMKARSHHKGSTLAYLKAQFHARVKGRGWKYPSIGIEYRSEGTKKIVMKKPGVNEVEYLRGLVEHMIEADLQSDHAAEAVTAISAVRRYARISPLHTSQWSIDEQRRLNTHYDELCMPKDDTLLLELLEKYKGSILYDFDDSSRPKRSYKVLDVQYDNKGGSAYWEATCVEVRMDSKGVWSVPDEFYVRAGSERVVNPKGLWGVILVCLKDPENPAYKPYTDEYILAHEQREAARHVENN